MSKPAFFTACKRGENMEKFAHLKHITEDLLHGHLTKLKMEYENDTVTLVNIVYEDDNHYSFDYVIEVDNKTHNVRFIEHFCEYANDHIALKRSRIFEDAVAEYLFHTAPSPTS